MENQEQSQAQNPEQNQGGNPESQQQNQDTPKTYTRSEVDREIQKSLETFKTNQIEKIAQEARQKIEAELAEAEKLKKMTAEEKAKFESEKEKARFDKEKADFQREKLHFETAKQLVAEGYDEDYADFLVGVDAESTMKNLKTFMEFDKARFQKAVEKAVEERLGTGFVPKTATSTSGVTLDSFLKMSYQEKNDLYENNRPLYDSLMAQYKQI